MSISLALTLVDGRLDLVVHFNYLGSLKVERGKYTENAGLL